MKLGQCAYEFSLRFSLYDVCFCYIAQVSWACALFCVGLAPVVQKSDSAIHRINLYLVDNAIGFPNTYPLDSDLSGG